MFSSWVWEVLLPDEKEGVVVVIDVLSNWMVCCCWCCCCCCCWCCCSCCCCCCWWCTGPGAITCWPPHSALMCLRGAKQLTDFFPLKKTKTKKTSQIQLHLLLLPLQGCFKFSSNAWRAPKICCYKPRLRWKSLGIAAIQFTAFTNLPRSHNRTEKWFE